MKVDSSTAAAPLRALQRFVKDGEGVSLRRLLHQEARGGRQMNEFVDVQDRLVCVWRGVISLP